LSAYSTHSKRADFAGFILFNDKEEEIFSFGKYKGRIVEDVFKETLVIMHGFKMQISHYIQKRY